MQFVRTQTTHPDPVLRFLLQMAKRLYNSELTFKNQGKSGMNERIACRPGSLGVYYLANVIEFRSVI
jgi:hypothetical protein